MALSREDEEIVKLERAFWDAIRDGDAKAATALVADEGIVTGGQGASRIEAKSFGKMMENDKWEFHSYEFVGEPVVLRPTPDVALIAYKVKEELTVDGKPLTLEAADSSTWLRIDGKWKCAVHTESVLGDPFGRDRVGAAHTTDASASSGKPAIASADAVANLAVKDVPKARKFYEETLGLKPVGQMGDEVVAYKSGNSTVNVYHSEFAGTNKATAVTWSVPNIEYAVEDLKKKGVSFEHYDMPDVKVEGDVHVAGDMKVAWFKDPDGNILNLIQES